MWPTIHVVRSRRVSSATACGFPIRLTIAATDSVVACARLGHSTNPFVPVLAAALLTICSHSASTGTSRGAVLR